VNDIAVECGNALYQPVLDRYIAGEDVPFAEVKKVHNKTNLQSGQEETQETASPDFALRNRGNHWTKTDAMARMG
jgi:hypothetical protein